MKPRIALLAGTLLLGLLCGCAGTASRSTTASQLDAVIDSPLRPATDRARDNWRHPRQTLLFFGVRPHMTVVEIAPGGGWYTRILAPLLREEGHYVAALPPRIAGNAYSERQYDGYMALLASAPQAFDRVQTSVFAPGQEALGPAGSADMVLSFRNLHNWLARGQAEAALASMHAVLKPGGVLGLVDHRAASGQPVDPKAATGYVSQSQAIRLAEAAGFRLVGISEVNANPRDPRNHPRGVWNLPPTYIDGDLNRATYAAIGESDRFTLKFIKPR
jgi:predicted methyltransferase